MTRDEAILTEIRGLLEPEDEHVDEDTYARNRAVEDCLEAVEDVIKVRALKRAA